jgi:hypothetical protein
MDTSIPLLAFTYAHRGQHARTLRPYDWVMPRKRWHTLLIARKLHLYLWEITLISITKTQKNKNGWQKVHPTKLHFLSSYQTRLSHLTCSIRHVMSIYHRPNDQRRDYGSASWVPWNAISICNDQRARRVSDSRPGCSSRMNKPLWRATKLRGAPHMHKSAIEWDPFSSLPDSSSSIYKNTTSTLHIYICKLPVYLSPIRPALYKNTTSTLHIYICKLPMYSTGLWQTLARLQNGIPCSSFTMCYWITGKFTYGFQLQLEKVSLASDVLCMFSFD